MGRDKRIMAHAKSAKNAKDSSLKSFAVFADAGVRLYFFHLETEVALAAETPGEDPEEYTLTGSDVNAIVRATLKEAGLTRGWKPQSE